MNMVKTIRIWLQKNRILRASIYFCARWFCIRVLNLKGRLIRRYGYEAMDKIYNVAIEASMPYHAAFGTLLGFVREGRFIPHDQDIDFAMMPDNRKLKLFFGLLEDAGFEFERFLLFDGKLHEFSVRYKEISIDFFQLYYDESKKNICHVTDKKDSYWPVFYWPTPTKLIQQTICGAKTFVPDNYEVILKNLYGDWRTPVVKWESTMAPKFEKDFSKHLWYQSRNRVEWDKYLEKVD